LTAHGSLSHSASGVCENNMIQLILGVVISLSAGVAFAGMPDLPAVSKSTNGKSSDAAVVVGIEDYPQISTVPYAKADSKAFYNWLRSSGVADPGNIRLFNDFEGERQDIINALVEAKKDVGPGGRVWFYFAGHGIAHPNSGERLFVMGSGGPDNYATRSISFDDVKNAVAGTPLTVVADACFNGKGRDGSDITGGKRNLFALEDIPSAPGDNVESWFSTTDAESSSPLDGAQQGAFTYFLVGGLSGWADKNGDKKVDNTELHEFVKTSLRTIQIRNQTPTFSGDKRTVVAGLSIAAPLFDPNAAKQKKTAPSNGMSSVIKDLQRQLASATVGSREQHFIQAKLLKKEATNEWVELVRLAANAGPKAADAIAKFIDTYEGRTVGTPADRMPVQIAELEDARRKLEALKQAAPTGPDDGIDPRTRALAMAKDRAWAASTRKDNPGVIFPGSGFGEFDLGTIQTIETIAAGACMASGVKLKPRACSSVKGGKVQLVDKIEVQQRLNDHNVKLIIGLTAGRVHRIVLSGFGATPEGAAIGKSSPRDLVTMYGEPTDAQESRIGVKLVWAQIGLTAQFKKDGTLFSLIATSPK
jgi:hypothetical protein